MSGFSPRMCPLRLGRHFQTRWRQRATKFLWPGVGALRSCAVNRASNTRKPAGRSKIHAARVRTEFNRPGALRGLCGLHSLVDLAQTWKSRSLTHAPGPGALVKRVTRLRGHLFQTRWRQHTEIRPAWALLALVRRKSGPSTRRQRRSKIHAAERVFSAQHAPTAIGASFIPNTMEAALHSTSGPAWCAPCSRVQQNRASNTRKPARPWPGACSARTRPHCDWASFISKHDGGTATQKFLQLRWRSLIQSTRQRRSEIHAPGACSAPACALRVRQFISNTMERSATQNSPARRGVPRIGRATGIAAALENSCGSARAQAPHAPTAIGAPFISNTMEAALHRNSSAWRVALLALVRRKSGVQHEEERSLEKYSCGSARAQSTRPLRLGRHLFQTRWRQRYTEIPLARREGAPCTRAQQIGRPDRKEGSLENSCGPARAQPRTRPLRLERHLFQTRWRQRYTEILRPGVGVPCAHAQISVQREEGSVARNHAARRSHPACAHCDWGVIYFKHDGGSATQKFLWPGVGAPCARAQ
jgi:hypothetical protein